MSFNIFLKSTNSSANIANGELVSFIVHNEELIHSKDAPGWNASDIEMFPVIGPTKLNNYTIETIQGFGKQDQHGLLREFEYKLVFSDDTKAIFEKKYEKNTQIKNSKFPKKSTQEHLFWPYDFVFRKIISLSNSSLHIDFEIISDKGMPFMIGYHPSFKLSGSGNEIIKTKEEEISLKTILDVGSAAYKVLNTNEIFLVKNNTPSVKITTENFNNFMLWTEVNNMVCIEPISHYPLLTTQKYSEKNMRISTGKDLFSVTISAL
ncbi:aldose 1-epimerase [uncultured Tenacibaculum sp.]|uniref:aldose epimerase family protein n=1 Tax=uncultured Tenacibaculum sp. TaxID=174713 RepID=UPI00262E6B13|nr:aldose 1-epimerase [uncultured Tenacibaculum sp.]